MYNLRVMTEGKQGAEQVQRLTLAEAWLHLQGQI